MVESVQSTEVYIFCFSLAASLSLDLGTWMLPSAVQSQEVSGFLIDVTQAV